MERLLKPIYKKRKRLDFDKEFKYKGARINYTQMGEGKPIVLIHGAIAPKPWGKSSEELAKHFKLYIIELPGFGASDAVEGEIHNPNFFAKVVHRFLQNKGLLDATLLGFSMGAVVSMKIALKGDFKGKAIFVGAPQKVGGFVEKILMKLPVFIRRLLVSSLYIQQLVLLPSLSRNLDEKKLAKKKEERDKFFKKMQEMDVRAVVDTDYIAMAKEVPELLKNILTDDRKDNYLFIYGEKDPQSKYGVIKDFLVVDKRSHNAFWSDPSQIVGYVKEFLNR